MRAALVIAAKDLRERIRDRTALIVAVVAPFGLAAIFSMILPSSDGGLDLRYALVDLDRSEISSGFAEGPLAGVEQAGIATVTEHDDEAAARDAVEDEADAAVVIPAGFGEAVMSGENATIEVIGGSDAGLATQVLRSLATSYTGELHAVRLSVAATLAASEEPPAPEVVADLAQRASATGSPITLVDEAADAERMPATTFYAASMAIFFLFFTAQFGILSLLAERREGTLPRLVAAPIPPWAIVAGKAIGSFILGIVAMAVLIGASTFLLGADWGNPIGVALLAIAAVIAAMGITAAIATLARTEEQAGGWNAIVAVTLGILGGSFFDLAQAPEFLGQLSLITPHAWFLRGLNELAGSTFEVGDLLLPIGALLAFGVITGAIGLVRAGRLVVAR